MRFNPEIVDLQCQACGYIEVVDERAAAERVLNAVLRTAGLSLGQRRTNAALSNARRLSFPGADFGQLSIAQRCFGTAPEDQDLERRKR
jgi:hypothetical protein